ncbi:MAG: SGNH/GDSL hydrolase family protein, partial [Planctomycetes bacterium]|nr:SGNH/GDSL hydrolase family protein [Planctomycetota bacterium]
RMRDDEDFPMEKPEGEIRIAGIGDSVMFGAGVKQKDTFLELLEEALNSAQRRNKVRCMNLGVPGYNSVQEMTMYRLHARRFRPDLTILQFVENDVCIPNFVAAGGRLKSAEEEWYRVAQSLSGLVPLTIPPEYRNYVGLENLRRAYQEIARMVKEDRTNLVLTFDYHDFCMTTPEEEGWLSTTIKRMCLEQNLAFVQCDPLPYFKDYLQKCRVKEAKPYLWASTIDPHPDPQRHALTALALWDTIHSRDLLPTRLSASEIARGREVVLARLKQARKSKEP